ncbi:MAG: hypothetical protein M1587_11860, partial [Thaumarchaeota archaeon]|nr:hypothetical protein [Nitrososphaerota archaeon]
MTSSAILPVLTDGRFDDISLKSLYVASYGFEERSLGWTNSLIDSKSRVSDSLIFNYVHPRGRNRVADMRRNLKKIGEVSMHEISYDLLSPQGTEDSISESLRLFEDKDEIIIDISSMTKLLILVTLCKLQNFPRQVRIVYSEAEDYAPSRATYERAKKAMKQIANMPSRGFYNLVRAECLSSTRMQGQPITMFAFTSFNEQLVRHVLGSISPNRLILINGRPPLGM